MDKDKIIHVLRVWLNSQWEIMQFEHCADAILALQSEHNKDKIIEKQAELIKKLNHLSEYLHQAVEYGEDGDWEEVFDRKLGKIKQLESEITALQSEQEPVKEMSAEEML